MRRTYVLLILIVALYIASRFALVFYGYSHISHPYFDEPVSGTLTFDLLHDGLRVPLMAYQYEQRSGDMMMESLLMAPLAVFAGHSMFTIKLFALLCTLLCMLGWVYLINRYCGMTAALACALLFALPPPMFARLGLVGTFSSHHMINHILLIQLLCFFRMLEKDSKRVPLFLWFVFGVCAGLGMYAFYSYIIFNAFCALFLLWRKPVLLSLRGVCALCAGAVIGFLPWLWRSVFYSSGGGNFLMEIFKNISLSPWSFIQTFFHTVPYTLGYGYPTREIGWTGCIVAVLLLVMTVAAVRAALRPPQSVHAGSAGCFGNAGMSTQFFLFVALYPVFYLVCLTLSPMQVNPLEYWPTIGVFATFAPADVIRSRWMTAQFPFYFACAGVLLAVMMRSRTGFVKSCSWFVVAAVAVLNFTQITGMLSREDDRKIFLYKGYNFDQHASRLLISRGFRLDAAVSFVDGYPEENREEAYRILGSSLASVLSSRDDFRDYLFEYLDRVTETKRDQLVYGLLRVLHGSPKKAGDPWVQELAARYPDIFYKNWGSQVLGYRYYGFLLNRQLLLANIPASERFFFSSYLENFRTSIQDEYNTQFVDRVSAYDEHTVEELLLTDINAVPESYRGLSVQGIGRLVGAEMLFDTLHKPDYPLSSAIGGKFGGDLTVAFYKGVGNGFAETLCRYWRRLMPPDAIDCSSYARGLDIEWQRCMSLMEQMPDRHMPLIWEGFVQELDQRTLNDSITAFIARKLSMH